MDEENCGTNGGCMWMCSDVETVQNPSKPLVFPLVLIEIQSILTYFGLFSNLKYFDSYFG